MLKLRLLLPALMVLATPALADPCKAIPDNGPMPPYLSPGSRFQGTVTYVGDGDSLCVAVSQKQTDWVEVRVADFYAPELHAPGGREAKAALKRIAMGRTAICSAGRRSHDRIVARCTIEGISIGDRMRRAGIAQGGTGR